MKAAEKTITQTTDLHGFFGRLKALFMIIGALTISFLPKRLAQHFDLSVVTPAKPTQPIQQTPTIFVHGFRGGLQTTDKMVTSALNYTHQQAFLKVIVDWRGGLRYQGTWTQNENPIIQIIFEENIASMRMHSRWLELVLPTLKKRYGFKTFNAVGHSVGATALLNCLLENDEDPKFPTLNKVILVAGPFNGVIALGDIPNVNQLTASGRPLLMSLHYFYWFIHKKHFPKKAKVLNIYGNTDTGSNSDSYITVNSAKSVNYLLHRTTSIYHEVEVHGERGEHSTLHDNHQVIRMINDFLFNDQVLVENFTGYPEPKNLNLHKTSSTTA